MRYVHNKAEKGIGESYCYSRQQKEEVQFPRVFTGHPKAILQTSAMHFWQEYIFISHCPLCMFKFREKKKHVDSFLWKYFGQLMCK